MVFSTDGGTDTLHVESTVREWYISVSEDWISVSPNFGIAKAKDIVVSVSSNPEKQTRIGFVYIAAAEVDTLRIKIIQHSLSYGYEYPDYSNPIPADQTGMTSNVITIAKQISMGWNMGNSLEVPGGETGWGNAKATQLLIDSIHAAGFNAIRLPCAWNSYIEDRTTYKLKTSWLARVKEVVDYCYQNQMYVILNIHWDGGWLENNVTTAKQDENNAKQKALWEQIALFFRDYDEHLLFAGTNEPNVDNSTQMNVLKTYLQTFIDAVRSTGGRNAYRSLIFQGPSTDIAKTNTLMKSLPVDLVENRLMAEVHFYTPWNFCGLEKDESWGKMFYYWGKNNHSSTDTERNPNWGEEAEVDQLMQLMKRKFADKGIPVILGEYGALKRSKLTGESLQLHLASRAYYMEYVTQKAKENGMIPFVWDNGALGNHGMGIFDRSTGKVVDSSILQAIQSGAAQGRYPF